MSDRPPPYFPQSSLSPQDDNRYKKFKLLVALAILGLIVILARRWIWNLFSNQIVLAVIPELTRRETG
ncbi:MAG: hypothetical protein WKF71_13190 [Pyrinomonadaceae bacterium]